MVIHAFCTWLIANLVHPIMWTIMMAVAMVIYGDSFGPDFLLSMALLTIFSLAASFPCWMIASVCLVGICSFSFGTAAKFRIWLITVPVLIVLEFSIVQWYLFGVIEKGSFIMILPALAATVFTISIRYKKFKALFHSVPVNMIGEGTIENQLETH